MSIITQDYNGEWLFIDGSVVKSHQHSSGVASHQDEAIGKSVAGNSSKIYLVVNVCDNPVCIEVTSGQLHDSQMANTLIKQTVKNNTEAVIDDRGYDSKAIRGIKEYL